MTRLSLTQSLQKSKSFALSRIIGERKGLSGNESLGGGAWVGFGVGHAAMSLCLLTTVGRLSKIDLHNTTENIMKTKAYPLALAIFVLFILSYPSLADGTVKHIPLMANSD